MAIIRNIIPPQKPSSVLPPKIPVKEKWERLTGNAARKLNEKTSHWQRAQQRYFLVAFCGCFISLLSLSFLFTMHPLKEHAVVAPDVSRHILPEKQISKVLPPPGPGKERPPVPPDSTLKKSSIHSH